MVRFWFVLSAVFFALTLAFFALDRPWWAILVNGLLMVVSFGLGLASDE